MPYLVTDLKGAVVLKEQCASAQEESEALPLFGEMPEEMRLDVGCAHILFLKHSPVEKIFSFSHLH